MIRSMTYRTEETQSLSSDKDFFSNMKIESSNTSEYSLFHDYLGLINLIIPSAISSPMDSPNESSNGSSFEYPISGNSRRRIDSYDSDSISDSSSSGSRAESEVFYDTSSPDIPVKPTTLPFMQEPPVIPFVPGLESLLARQTAFNHFQNVMSANKSNNNNSKSSNKATVCVFCRNNGESKEFYSSHTLKDTEGNTTCPILRAYTCPLCKASGDQSHTIKYCPNYTPKMRENKLLGIPI
nr:nanos1 protein [Cladonema pacificum]